MAFIFLHVFKLHSWQNLLESTRTCHRSVKYPTGCSRIGLNGSGLALRSADPESAAGVDGVHIVAFVKIVITFMHLCVYTVFILFCSPFNMLHLS